MDVMGNAMIMNLTLNFTSTSAYTMTATSQYGNGTETGTYSVSGNTITLTVVTNNIPNDTKPGETKSATISADGRTFTTNDGLDTQRCQARYTGD